MKTFAVFYEATLPQDVEQLPDGTYRSIRETVTIYALDPQMTKYHRIDGPAYRSPYFEQWWVNGQLHRIGGPALVSDRRKEWWLNGRLHRINGPAYIGPRTAAWWLNGQRHRIGGPAVVSDGRKEWWVEGVKFTEEDYNNLMKKLSTLTDASDREATIAAATMFD